MCGGEPCSMRAYTSTRVWAVCAFGWALACERAPSDGGTRALRRHTRCADTSVEAARRTAATCACKATTVELRSATVVIFSGGRKAKGLEITGVADGGQLRDTAAEGPSQIGMGAETQLGERHACTWNARARRPCRETNKPKGDPHSETTLGPQPAPPHTPRRVQPDHPPDQTMGQIGIGFWVLGAWPMVVWGRQNPNPQNAIWGVAVQVQALYFRTAGFDRAAHPTKERNTHFRGPAPDPPPTTTT